MSNKNGLGTNELPADASVPIEVFWPNVLVEKQKAITKTASGIHIPTSHADGVTPTRGIVRAVGRIDLMTGEAKSSPIKDGDMVQFSKMAGSSFNKGDDGYVLLALRDILMRIHKPTK
jgi:co-chaperonin GroES (HSP10)